MNKRENLKKDLSNIKLLFVLINIAVLTICLLVGFYIAFTNTDNNYRFLFTLPILFGTVFVLILSKALFMRFRPFHIVFTIIGFFRYCILPLGIVVTGRYYGRSPINPTEDSFILAFVLMLYELVVCSLLIFYLDLRERKSRNTFFVVKDFSTNIHKSNFIYYLYTAIIIFCIILKPETLKSINFIIPNYSAVHQFGDIDFVSKIIVYGTMLAKQIIFVLLITRCKVNYEKFNSKLYSWLAIGLVCFNSMIFFGLNRSDFVLLLMSSSLLYCYLFPRNIKKMAILSSVGLIIVVPAITVARNMNTILSTDDILWNFTDFMQIYLGGPYNVAMAVETAKFFPHERHFLNFIYELGRPIIGLGYLFKLLPFHSSTDLYNYRIFFSDHSTQIIPMIGEGYFYFGLLFAPIINIIFILIAYKLDNVMIKSNRIEIIYFFTLTYVRLGFMMGQNAMIQLNDMSYNIVIFLMIYWLNNHIYFYIKPWQPKGYDSVLNSVEIENDSSK